MVKGIRDFLGVKALIVLMLLLTVGAKAQQKNEKLILSLERSLEIALSDNLTLKVAEEELTRVDYLKRENWYALFPSVNASAQYTNNILKPVFFSDFFPGGKMEMGSTNSYAVSGALQLPLFSMAIYKNIELSDIEIKAALESARSTKLDLIMQVKNSFYGVIMMKESLEVLEQSYKNAKESSENISRMYQEGMASEYDKIRADVSVRNITPSLTQAKNALELSKMQLKILLSLPLDLDIDVEGSLGEYRQGIISYNTPGAINLEGNSNIKNMDIQLEKLQKNYELITSQKLPVLSGFMNYQLQMQNEDFSFNKQWVNSVSAGFSLSIPIFNKFSINMKQKQTKVGIRQLEMQRDLLSKNMEIGARNALNEMARAKSQLESDAEAVKQATKAYEIAKVRYSTGAGTVLELNDSEVALTRSKLTLNQTVYDFLKAKNEFEKIEGSEIITANK